MERKEFIEKLKKSYDTNTPDYELIQRLKSVNELAEIKARENKDMIKKGEKINEEHDEQIMSDEKNLKEIENFKEKQKLQDESLMLQVFKNEANRIKRLIEALKSDIDKIEKTEKYGEEILKEMKKIKDEFDF